MFRLLRSHAVHIQDVLRVAMSTNKRIGANKAGGVAKKLCVHDRIVDASVTGSVSSALGTMTVVEVMPSPVKSESDKKSYRVIRLSNGLKALLISDPTRTEDAGEDAAKGKRSTSESEAAESSSSEEEEGEEEGDNDDGSDDEAGEDGERQKQAACALCVGVGSFSDPREVQGLAHFLEHMIFMGSEKYPSENEFDQYIKKCGGYDNADTDYEETSYYFEVQEPHLDGAMDRFSQLLKAPLMKKDAMGREREAVESEFSSKMNEVDVRRDQLLASLGNADHPVSIFAWGNLATLKDTIDDDQLYEKVHAFRRRHYSASRMYLCVQARLPLDDLQHLAVKHFAGIVNTEIDGDDFSKYTYENAFQAAFYEQVYFVKPIANVSRVDITWCMGPVVQAYKTKPHHYLSFLLGHEGTGSLLAYLRKRLWCMDLAAGIDESGLGSNSLFSLFSISVHVTDEGFKHLTEIFTAIFSYIRFLREAGPSERIFNELKTIEETSFRFSQERDPIDNVEDLVVSLKHYPSEHLLNGDSLYFEYDPVAIQNIIDAINKPQFNVMITSTHLYDDDVKYEMKEKWFGTEYCSRDVPAEWRAAWNDVKPYPEFALPEVNPYIADDFTILLKEGVKLPKSPTKLIDNEVCELWHRQDDRFLLPIARYYFYFTSPHAMNTAKNMVLMGLYSAILKYQLVEKLYPATCTGLEYSCYTAEKGLVLKVSGYHQKLHRIVNSFAASLKALANDVTEDQYNVFVEQQSKNFENIFVKPDSINKDFRLSIIDTNHIPLPAKNRILKTITFNDFKDFCHLYLQEIRIKAVMQGNLDAASAENIMTDVLQVLDCGKVQDLQTIEIHTSKIPLGSMYLRCKSYSPNDVNTVVTNFYQVGPITIRLNALIDLLLVVAEEPLFDILRTKEQLGYDVSCGIRDNQGILGYSISVNSQESKFTVDHIDERIENFRTELVQIIKNMTGEDFQTFKESLIQMKLTDDNDLKDEIARNWAEVTTDEYIFDRAQKEVNALETITQNDLLEFYLSTRGEHERKFATQIIGNPNGNSDEIAVTDKSTFDGYAIVELKEGNLGHLIRNVEEFKKSLEVYPRSKTIPE